MKKIIFLVCIFGLFMSCVDNDDNIFEETVDVRMQKNKEEFFKHLTQGKWVIDFFPGTYKGYGGTAIHAEFFKNYKVNLHSERGAGKDGTSYDIISRSGSLLSFNEYNEGIHWFAEPNGYKPEGKFGVTDYEFIYQKKEGDILYTKGIKSLFTYRFVKTELTYEEYFAKQKEIKDLFETKQAVRFTVNGKSIKFKMKESTGSTFTYYDPDEKDKKKQKKRTAFVFTDKGVRFFKPFTLNGVEIFELFLNKEKSIFENKEKTVKIELLEPPIDLMKESWAIVVEEGKVPAKFIELFLKSREAMVKNYYSLGSLYAHDVYLLNTIYIGKSSYRGLDDKLRNTGISFASENSSPNPDEVYYPTIRVLEFKYDFADEHFNLNFVTTVWSNFGRGWSFAKKHLRTLSNFIEAHSYKIENVSNVKTIKVEKGKYGKCQEQEKTVLKTIKITSTSDPEVWFYLYRVK